MHNVKIICILILLIAVAIFTFQNTTAVEIKFLIWSHNMSVSLMLLTALFSGIIIGMVLSFLNARRKSKQESTAYTQQS